MSAAPSIRYCPETGSMAIEVRPWPGSAVGGSLAEGGEDAGTDVVIHYAADGRPWLWEIEHVSTHPEHIAAALQEIRRLRAVAA